MALLSPVERYFWLISRKNNFKGSEDGEGDVKELKDMRGNCGPRPPLRDIRGNKESEEKRSHFKAKDTQMQSTWQVCWCAEMRWFGRTLSPGFHKLVWLSQNERKPKTRKIRERRTKNRGEVEGVAAERWMTSHLLKVYTQQEDSFWSPRIFYTHRRNKCFNTIIWIMWVNENTFWNQPQGH